MKGQVHKNKRGCGYQPMGPTWPLLFLEPFYGGSHKQLVDLLVGQLKGDLYTLPASKWHWRSRVAALSFAHILPPHHSYKLDRILKLPLTLTDECPTNKVLPHHDLWGGGCEGISQNFQWFPSVCLLATIE